MAGIYDSLWEADDAAGEASEAYTHTKELVVVLVDCRGSMMQGRQGGTTPCQTALGALARHMRARIVSSPSDELGIVLYGTARQNSDLTEQESLTQFDHIYVQHSLDFLSARRIMDTESLAAETADNSTAGSRQNVSSAESATDLVHALWTASQMFSKSSAAHASKKLWIFTDDDFAGLADASSRSTIINRAQDLTNCKVDVELFPLAAVAGQQRFSMGAVWKDVLGLSTEEEAEAVLMGATDSLDGLCSAIYAKASRKRALGSIQWVLGEGLAISVQVYALVGKHTKGAAKTLDAQNHEVLHRQTAYTCEDTGTALQYITKRYLPVRDEKVVLPDEAMADWRARLPPGLELLGFKPRESLKDYHQLRSSYFVYPNDKLAAGSTATFVALWREMLDQRKVAIARYARGKTSMPRLAALVPQEEKVDKETGCQKVPPGMHLIILPFADDIRSPEESVGSLMSKPDKTGVQAAVAMMDAMCLVGRGCDDDPVYFNSSDLANPAIQRRYAVLHAVALQEPVEASARALQDETDFRVWEFDTHDAEACLGAIRSFKDAVYGPGFEEPVPAAKGAAAGSKRKAAEEISAETIRAASRTSGAGGVSRLLTVAQLKAHLKDNGKSDTGKKADLVQRVVDLHMPQ